MPAELVRQWIGERRLDGRSLVQQVGSDAWKPLAEYPEFSASLREGARPPALSAMTSPARGPVTTGGRSPVSGLAIASFVLGMLAYCTGVTAILGLIFGAVALRKIRRSQGRMRGRGFAIAGITFSLLAVVILPAVLVPLVSKKARMMGDTTGECLSHVQQLSRAVRMYANDNNDFLPPAATWCDAIQKDLSDSAGFECPMRPGLRSGFAFNAAIAGRKDQDVDPRTVMLFESDGGWNAAGGAEAAASPPRHRGSIVVAFADGSARPVPVAEVAGLRWNP